MRQLPPQSEPSFGFAQSPFGECCIVFSNDGICALTFPENHESALYDIEQRFPETNFVQNDTKAAYFSKSIFQRKERPGSGFQPGRRGTRPRVILGSLPRPAGTARSG